jgi:hypothetical protein
MLCQRGVVYMVAGALTLRVELENLQVHVGVCDDDVQLLIEGQKVGCDALEMMFASAKEHHLVWFFLLQLLARETSFFTK